MELFPKLSHDGNWIAFSAERSGTRQVWVMPAWGGLIGLSGNATFVDGGSVDVPTFRIFDREGSWDVENEGVAPDGEIFDVAEERFVGGDPNLEKGVEILLEALSKRPGVKHRLPVTSSRRELSQRGTGTGAWKNTTPPGPSCRESPLDVENLNEFVLFSTVRPRRTNCFNADTYVTLPYPDR